MKTKIKKMQVGIIFLFLLGACASSNNQELLKGTQILSSAEYGYTPENPVAIWAATAKDRKHKKAIFLEGLRSRNGAKYEIIEKDFVPNPNYEAPRIKIYNIFTDEIINKGKGEFIELYCLKSSKGKDTINIYITTHIKGRTLVPVGLSFASN